MKHFGTLDAQLSSPIFLMHAQNPDEIFDVVDSDDRPVRKATRREVHLHGLRHRAVHVLVSNAKGQVFLQKRSMAKDTAPGRWDSSSSGHLDAGETYDACAVRELWEELGLKLPYGISPKRLFHSVACDETGNEFVWVYHVLSEGPFTLHPAEIETGAWYTPAEISEALVQRPREFTRAFSYLWPRAVSLKG